MNSRRPWTLPDPWKPNNGFHRSLENHTTRGFPRASTAIALFLMNEEKTNRNLILEVSTR
jgi:hypothetical protein